MNTRMKLSAILMAGGLLASGAASAATVFEWGWSGTLADWANNGGIIDRANGPAPQTAPNIADPTYGTVLQHGGDGDTTFTLDPVHSGWLSPVGSATGPWTDVGEPDTGHVTLKEEEVDGRDLYNVGIGWAQAQGSGTLAYTISTIGELLTTAALDTVVSLVGDVSKYIYADASTYIVDLNANTLGAHSLLTLHSVDGARDPASPDLTSFGARASIYVVDRINSGAINDIHNEFSVPEPASLSLFGIGLAAAFGRRRRAGNAAV